MTRAQVDAGYIICAIAIGFLCSRHGLGIGAAFAWCFLLGVLQEWIEE